MFTSPLEYNVFILSKNAALSKNCAINLLSMPEKTVSVNLPNENERVEFIGLL